jgi:hypothetical protein
MRGGGAAKIGKTVLHLADIAFGFIFMLFLYLP